MRRNQSRLLSLTLLTTFFLTVLFLADCQQVENGHSSSAPASTGSGNTGKIAITTSSEEARKEYLSGRDLQEKLRITDSIQHFDKAISLDPNFALAELNRANVSPK